MFIARFDESKAKIPLAIAVVAVSDTHTLETDKGGALLQSLIEGDGHRCIGRSVVRDDVAAIRAAVKRHVADPGCDVVISTGGTGFSARDVTPEAIEPLLDKRMEGFAVLFHQYSATTVGTSTLKSRALAGVIGSTFVFCVPGSRGACRDAWEGILRHQFDTRHEPCSIAGAMPQVVARGGANS